MPSLTELAFFLDRGPLLVGRTRFCDQPAEAVAAIPIVGGTKNPDVSRIIALAPDLVIANKEENRREDVEALQAAGLRVLVTDPNTVAGAIDMIRQMGDELDAGGLAQQLIDAIRSELEEPSGVPGTRVLVAVWWKPLMVLGSESYGHDLLASIGAVNVAAGRARYPELTLDEARELAPDVILLPDEPFPFKPSHVAEFSAIAPAMVIDGRLLWWYGPRIPAAIRSLRALLARVPATP